MSRASTPPCQLDLLSYQVISPPVAISVANVSPVLTARARGGTAEYVLPACACKSARVSVLANITSTKATHCNVTLNDVLAEVRPTGQSQLLGTIVAPLLSPEQIGLVLEDITPSSCAITEVRLLPVESSVAARSEIPPNAMELQQHPNHKRQSSKLPDTAAAVGNYFMTTPPCWRANTREIWRACKDSNGRCAFATLVLNDRFGAYAYALYRSLKATGTTAPLVVMTTPDVSEATISTLLRLGGDGNATEAAAAADAVPIHPVIRVHRIDHLQYPPRYQVTHEDNETRKSLRFTKLEAWRLIGYRKVVLIDTDTMVLRNIDALFTCAAGSAVADMGAPSNFNSGVFVLDPSEAVHVELKRLTQFLISYNQGDQGFLSKAFPEWRRRPELQLPEVYNYFLKWRNSNAWFSSAWTKGVHVLHFTDIVKPHNWFLHPSTTSFTMPARLSFVGQQGDVFQSWIAMADEYKCAHGRWLTCDPKVFGLRNEQCRSIVGHYAKPAEAPASFSVMISHSPFRNPHRIAVLVRVEKSLQTIPELHTIFLIVHGRRASSLKQSGKKPLVKISPQYDALGNRFGPIPVPTDGILIMDDDIVLDPRDISLAFEAWRQSPTQMVGTFMRAVTQEGNRFHYVAKGYTVDDMGMRRHNIVLTKLLFLHRHYLFMYACLLPYELWALPNKLLNCEDVLMNLMVGTASGLPPLPYMPIHTVQLDYGTPPPKEMLGTVVEQAGLSGQHGADQTKWFDSRSSCTAELAAHFGGVAASTLSRLSVFQATLPFLDTMFAKHWIHVKSGRELEMNYSATYQTLLHTVSLEQFKARQLKLMDRETELPTGGTIPEILPITFRSLRCPTREDVLNTARKHRWLMWDDSTANCSNGCRLGWCFGGDLAPCCVKRQTARWRESCQSLPYGCYNPTSHEAKVFGAAVFDQRSGKLSTPNIEPSSSCPSHEEVSNTRRADRMRIWTDGTPPFNYSNKSSISLEKCRDGCVMAVCRLGKNSPCCVRRARVVRWEGGTPCEFLRYGCSIMGTEATPWKRILDYHAIPILRRSLVCPTREMVFNTHPEYRFTLWEDPMGTHDCKFISCSTRAPCLVKRLRVTSWPVACDHLPFGCPQASVSKPMRFGKSMIRDLRIDAEFGSGPWIRARFGTESCHWSAFILPSVLSVGVVVRLIICSHYRGRVAVQPGGRPQPPGRQCDTSAKPLWPKSKGCWLGVAFFLWAMICMQLVISSYLNHAGSLWPPSFPSAVRDLKRDWRESSVAAPRRAAG